MYSIKKRVTDNSSHKAQATKMRWQILMQTKKSLPTQPKVIERLFSLLYFLFHESWIDSISLFTACANLFVSFTSFIKARTTQSKRPIKVRTAPKKAVIKQSVPPFSKTLNNSYYTISIIPSNESTTAYLMKSVRKSPYFNAGMDRAYRL